MFTAETAHRLLLGQGNWSSLLEIALRAMVLFTLIIFSMRLLGRRVASQYTLFELSVVVTLAGAVGVPLQATDRGLLPPILIMLTVIVLHYTMARWSVRSPRFEAVISGSVSTIIQQGEIQLDELKRAALSRERLFAMLRRRQVQHLGQLKKCISGAFGRSLHRVCRCTAGGPVDPAQNRFAIARSRGRGDRRQLQQLRTNRTRYPAAAQRLYSLRRRGLDTRCPRAG